jgi:hypothetical protein
MMHMSRVAGGVPPPSTILHLPPQHLATYAITVIVPDNQQNEGL